MQEALDKLSISMSQITAIGITNQRETIVAWNKKTGEAIGNAIVWQCRRTADFCDELKKEGFEEIIRNKTGLLADPYFSGTKMRWILKNNAEANQLATKGDLLFGTVDSWLIWKLTGGKEHVTDVTNASRTMVFDIFKGKWDQEILDRFEIPVQCLAEVKGSSELMGVTEQSWGAEVPIAGVAGDQHASLFGQACFEKGMAKNTYGTGCFMLVNTGQDALLSKHGLLTTIAWKLGDKTTYALEGSVFMGGALIQWLRDGLGLFEDAGQTEAMALSVESSEGVYVVPAFVGLGAPHWDPYAGGLMIGLTRGTNKNHIVRAALEAIAFQSADLLKCTEKDTRKEVSTLRVDGGAVANNFLCQFQADLLQRNVSRPGITETTAMGAAFLAGLATGVWKDQEEIKLLWQEDRLFEPHKESQEIKPLVEGWDKAIKRSKGWNRN